MKKIAKDLGRVNSTANGLQRLYKLNPPLETHKFVVVSAVYAAYTGPETYIFPADEYGNVTSWIELDGSFRGDMDHETALKNAGYDLVHS